MNQLQPINITSLHITSHLISSRLISLSTKFIRFGIHQRPIMNHPPSAAASSTSAAVPTAVPPPLPPPLPPSSSPSSLALSQSQSQPLTFDQLSDAQLTHAFDFLPIIQHACKQVQHASGNMAQGEDVKAVQAAVRKKRRKTRQKAEGNSKGFDAIG